MDARRWWWRLSSMVALLAGTGTDAAAANGQDWGTWGMHMMWGSLRTCATFSSRGIDARCRQANVSWLFCS